MITYYHLLAFAISLELTSTLVSESESTVVWYDTIRHRFVLKGRNQSNLVPYFDEAITKRAENKTKK